MKTAIKKLYEGMFLVDSALAASDWEGVNAAINKILDKVGAELVSIRKWNECRLAYEIDHKSRGTYLLSYFRLEGPAVATLEREVVLSDKILRVLVLSAEHMSEEDINKETPSEQEESRKKKAEIARAEAAEAKEAADKVAADEAVEAAKLEAAEAEVVIDAVAVEPDELAEDDDLEDDLEEETKEQ